MAKQIIPPPPRPALPDIALFAKAYFNIDLTSPQLEMIAMVAAGKPLGELRISRRRMGQETANKIIRAYLQEGMKINGRARLPQHRLPPRERHKKGVSQEGRILYMIKRPGGAYNFELSRIALKYTSVISALRKEGQDIVADRQYNRHGKPTNTWRYRIGS